MGWAEEYDAMRANNAQIAQPPKQQSQGGLIGFLRGAGDSLTQSFQRVGKGFGNVLGEVTGENQRIRESLKKKSDATHQAQLEAIKKSKDTNLSQEQRDKYRSLVNKYTKEQNDTFNESQGFNERIAEENNPIKGAAAVGSIGLDILSGGGLGNIAKTGILKAAGRGAAQGALSGAGQGALQTVQEKGENATAEDILGSAVSGGTIGGIAGGALSGVANIPGALRRSGILSKAQSKAESAGSRLLASQSRGALDKRLAEEAPKVYKTMNDYGIRNVNDFQDVASKITGNEGAINLGKMNIIANSPKTVTATTWRNKALDTLNDATGITDRDEKAIRSILQKTDDNIQKSISNRLGTSRAAGVGEAHPEDLYRAAQDLQSKAYKSLGNKSYQAASDVQQAKFDILNTAARELKDTVDNSVSKEGIPDSIKNDIIADLQSRGIKNKKIIDQVKNAKSIGDLNKLESPFVKASQIGEQTASAANTRSLSVPTDYRGTTITGLAANAATPTINRQAGRGLLAIANKKVPEIPGPLPEAVKQIGAVGNIPIARGIGDMVQAPEPGQNQELPNTTNENVEDYDKSAIYQGYLPPEQDSSPFSSDNIQKLIIADLANGGKNVGTLLSLYETFGKSQEPQLTSKQIEAQDRAQAGLTALDQIEQAFTNAGGGQGFLGGLTNLAGNLKLNPQAEAYNRIRNSAISLIARGLGGSAQGSDKDRADIEQALPSITDSPEAARIKIQSLRDRLSAGSLSPSSDVTGVTQ